MTTRTPIIFLIFKRPDVTARIFETIRAARPPKLIVVADGPRPGRPEEHELCLAARAVTESVDWPCEVIRDYSEVNLGCAKRVSSGLTRAFEIVEEAIILEDDCLPHESFFPYCDELLARYRNEPRVMNISGDNFQDGIRRSPYSYYFSRYMHCWGWATWRRAWIHFDFDLPGWGEFVKSGGLDQWNLLRDERKTWNLIYKQLQDKSVDSWALRWHLSCWMRGGVTILPEVNLVANIGFGDGATSTLDTSSDLANRPVGAIVLDRHPPVIQQQVDADRYTYEHSYANQIPKKPPLLGRALHQLKRIVYRVGRPFKRAVKKYLLRQHPKS